MKQNALLFSNWQSDSKKCSLLQEIQIVEYKYSMVIIAIDIAYSFTKFDDFRFSRSSDMIGAPKIL